MYTGSHASTRKRQVTVRFTGHSRIVGTRYGTCFVSPFWRLEFRGRFYIFGKICGPLKKLCQIMRCMLSLSSSAWHPFRQIIYLPGYTATVCVRFEFFCFLVTAQYLHVQNTNARLCDAS
jgi:hypothetical protein